MVSGSGFAHGFCLGRSANSGIYGIDNGRKQHQHRSEHNNKQRSDSRLTEQHSSGFDGYCSRPNRHGSRSGDGDHRRTINYNESEQ